MKNVLTFCIRFSAFFGKLLAIFASSIRIRIYKVSRNSDHDSLHGTKYVEEGDT